MMVTRDYESVLKALLDEYCLFLVEPVYVESVHAWCKENGVEEPDKHKPLKLVVNEDKGCKLVINDHVQESVLKDRIKALSVRSALTNVAENKADMLDSEKKQLAYLFLSEYGSRLPENEDEILTDDWAFREMERLEFFKE